METLDLAGDPLFELEQKIARRADELSHRRTDGKRYPLIAWLEAEWEVLRDHARDAATVGGRAAG